LHGAILPIEAKHFPGEMFCRSRTNPFGAAHCWRRLALLPARSKQAVKGMKYGANLTYSWQELCQLWPVLSRRQGLPSDKQTPCQKQCQLGGCQGNGLAGRALPQSGKAAFFKALAVDGEAGTFVEQHLCAGAGAGAKQKAVTVQQLLAELPAHQMGKAVKTLAKIRWRWPGPDFAGAR
jgi:hypothetical protein